MLRLFMLMKCSNSFSVADVLMSERDISFFSKIVYAKEVLCFLLRVHIRIVYSLQISEGCIDYTSLKSRGINLLITSYRAICNNGRIIK